MSIPVFSRDSSFDRMVSDAQASALLAAGTHDLVRDRKGTIRRLCERERGTPLTAAPEEHFRWRGKMSGGAIVMQGQRFGFG